ncbi:hypothetical protein T492DRAFT_499488 [Pavlovales sp. CCMP2436]|nr:hypothetical protein T492DRAFT_499488 [Pavlovales sp. CCMP2436]
MPHASKLGGPGRRALQQDAYAEGFRAGILRVQQAARLSKDAPSRPAPPPCVPAPVLTLWSHDDKEPTAIAANLDPTRLTNFDLVLRAASLAGEALAWAVADECARNPSLRLPDAEIQSCVAHALDHLSVYERAGQRCMPPTSSPHAELRAGLQWLGRVHTEFGRPSYARFHAVANAELDEALARAGAIVKALSSASSGLRRNLQAVQLHARHARRDSVARSARGPGEEHVKRTIIKEEFPDSIEELEARVNALLDESTGGDPPGTPQLATPAAAAAAPKQQRLQAAGAPAPQPAASAATTAQPVTAHPDSSHTGIYISIYITLLFSFFRVRRGWPMSPYPVALCTFRFSVDSLQTSTCLALPAPTRARCATRPVFSFVYIYIPSHTCIHVS